MHFPSETGELCTAGSRGVTPNPTPPPPLAFLLPLVGWDLWPHFRAQKDKLFRSYCGDMRSYFLQLSAFWGGLSSTEKQHMPVPQLPHYKSHHLNPGWWRITSSKEEKQTSRSAHFLGWHAKLREAVPVSILVPLELFQPAMLVHVRATTAKQLARWGQSPTPVHSCHRVASSSTTSPPASSHPLWQANKGTSGLYSSIWVKARPSRCSGGGSHSKEKMLRISFWLAVLLHLNIESTSFRSWCVSWEVTFLLWPRLLTYPVGLLGILGTHNARLMQFTLISK